MKNKKMEGVRLSNQQLNEVTREAIKSSLIILMRDKDFNKISITDIVNKAGVSRTAYYNNYYYKEDVLKDLLNEFMDEIILTTGAIIDNQIQPEQLFKFVNSNRDIYLLLLKANLGDTILSEMTDKLSENIPIENKIERTRMAFWAGALYGTIKNWFLHEPNIDVEEIISIYNSLITDLFTQRQ